MLRPSLKSTDSVSSDTVTSSANGISNSTAKVLIPRLRQFDSVIAHQLFNTCNLGARKTTAALQPNGIEPELRDSIVSLHVNVLWFVAVTRVEEEPVRARPQNRRQVMTPYLCLSRLEARSIVSTVVSGFPLLGYKYTAFSTFGLIHR